jgi:hypothetical protein
VAPLEFAMVLPFLAILAGILFTMARASLARTDAIMHARHEAWHNRYGHGEGGSLDGAGAAASLWFDTGAGGLQTGSGSKSAHVQKLAPASQYFFMGTVTANAHHEVLSRPWDYEDIPYQSLPPMGIDPRAFQRALPAAGIGAIVNGLDLFSNIMNGIQPAHDAITAWNKVQNALNTVSKKLDELDREIRALEDRLRELRDRLRVVKDNAVIREIEREIDRIEGILKKLREAREKLIQGQKLAPH